MERHVACARIINELAVARQHQLHCAGERSIIRQGGRIHQDILPRTGVFDKIGFTIMFDYANSVNLICTR